MRGLRVMTFFLAAACAGPAWALDYSRAFYLPRAGASFEKDPADGQAASFSAFEGGEPLWPLLKDDGAWAGASGIRAGKARGERPRGGGTSPVVAELARARLSPDAPASEPIGLYLSDLADEARPLESRWLAPETSGPPLAPPGPGISASSDGLPSFPPKDASAAASSPGVEGAPLGGAMAGKAKSRPPAGGLGRPLPEAAASGDAKPRPAGADRAPARSRGSRFNAEELEEAVEAVEAVEGAEAAKDDAADKRASRAADSKVFEIPGYSLAREMASIPEAPSAQEISGIPESSKLQEAAKAPEPSKASETAMIKEIIGIPEAQKPVAAASAAPRAGASGNMVVWTSSLDASSLEAALAEASSPEAAGQNAPGQKTASQEIPGQEISIKEASGLKASTARGPARGSAGPKALHAKSESLSASETGASSSQESSGKVKAPAGGAGPSPLPAALFPRAISLGAADGGPEAMAPAFPRGSESAGPPAQAAKSVKASEGGEASAMAAKSPAPISAPSSGSGPKAPHGGNAAGFFARAWPLVSPSKAAEASMARNSLSSGPLGAPGLVESHGRTGLGDESPGDGGLGQGAPGGGGAPPRPDWEASPEGSAGAESKPMPEMEPDPLPGNEPEGKGGRSRRAEILRAEGQGANPPAALGASPSGDGPKEEGEAQELERLEAEERQKVYEESLAKLLPASPDEIRNYRKKADEKREAASDPRAGRLLFRNVRLDPEPGKKPPVVELTPNMVTAIVFNDSQGKPWPIASSVLGSGSLFQAEVLGGDSPGSIIVAPLQSHGASNLIVTLRGFDVPLVIELVASSPAKAGRDVDALVVFQVREAGPMSAPLEAQSRKPLSDAVGERLYAVMDGLAPQGGKALEAAPALEGEKVYIAGDSMYLRTRRALLWPAPRARAAGPGGLAVYELSPMTTLLLSSGEEISELKVPGARAAGAGYKEGGK